MRLHCHCGEVIYEGGNPQPEKAYFITSFAEDDVLDSLGEDEDLINVHKFLDAVGGDMLQCPVCGRLYIQDQQRHLYHCFVPDSDAVPKTLFARKTDEK